MKTNKTMKTVAMQWGKVSDDGWKGFKNTKILPLTSQRRAKLCFGKFWQVNRISFACQPNPVVFRIQWKHAAPHLFWKRQTI